MGIRGRAARAWTAVVAMALTGASTVVPSASQASVQVTELVVVGQLQTAVIDPVDGQPGDRATSLLLPDGTRLEVVPSPDLPVAGRITATIELRPDDVRGGSASLEPARLSTRTSRGRELAAEIQGPVQLRHLEEMDAGTPATLPRTAYVAVMRGRGDWGSTSDSVLRSRVQQVLDGWRTEVGPSMPSFTIGGWSDFDSSLGCGLSGDQWDFWDVVVEAEMELYPDVDFYSGGKHLVVLVPDECEQYAKGVGSMGRFTGGGYSISSFEDDGAATVLAHELGHNLGLGHSHGWGCDPEGCATHYYGDRYDVMGSAEVGAVPALSSAHRDDLGLLGEGEVASLELPPDRSEITRTVTLAPRGAPDGLRSLRVLEPETMEHWYVDYRSGTGRDSASWYATSDWGRRDYPAGVTIHDGAGNESLLHLRPDDAGSWGPGSTFTNDAGTISIRVGDIDRLNGATVTATVRSEHPSLVVPDTVTVTSDLLVWETLAVDTTTWPSDASLRITWFLDGEPYATRPAIGLYPWMRGSTVEVEVLATQPGHRGAVVRSGPLGTVRRPMDGSVQITAWTSPKARETLSSRVTLSDPMSADLTYQWFSDGRAVEGATGESYWIADADAGREMILRVTGRKDEYDVHTFVSNPIRILPPVPVGEVTVRGVPETGQFLHGTTSGWPEGTTLTYSWFRDDEEIPFTSRPLWMMRAADVGHEMSLRVTGELPGYSRGHAFSSPLTGAAGRLKTDRPWIVGDPKVGEVLLARSWFWTPDTRFRHQWLADGEVLAGATEKRLLVTRALRGKRLKVQVTGHLAGYTPQTRTSARTGRVTR